MIHYEEITRAAIGKWLCPETLDECYTTPTLRNVVCIPPRPRDNTGYLKSYQIITATCSKCTTSTGSPKILVGLGNGDHTSILRGAIFWGTGIEILVEVTSGIRERNMSYSALSFFALINSRS